MSSFLKPPVPATYHFLDKVMRVPQQISTVESHHLCRPPKHMPAGSLQLDLLAKASLPVLVRMWCEILS